MSLVRSIAATATSLLTRSTVVIIGANGEARPRFSNASTNGTKSYSRFG